MKKKIHVYGRHGNRTPFAYPEYRKLFSKHFDYVGDARRADYLVVGFNIDFRDNAPEVQRLKKENPSLRLVVFSEEPLWDTMWSGDFQKPDGSIKVKIESQEDRFDYHVLNHVTSRIFDFENVPYFITTSDDYYVRYASLFARNAAASSLDFKRFWQSARIRHAFYAARRVGTNFDVRFNNGAIMGLNSYRSLVAEGLQGEAVLREGQGWKEVQQRQALPDWHLDKLAALDRRSYVVSGLENTHLSTYVSEKIFDAFAVLGIPLYYAQPNHGALRLVEDGSFINLTGMSVQQSIDRINSFEPDDPFVDRYRATQARLAKLFATPKFYLAERNRVVSETVDAFSRI